MSDRYEALAGRVAALADEIDRLAAWRKERAHPEAHAEHGRADSERWCAERLRALASLPATPGGAAVCEVCGATYWGLRHCVAPVAPPPAQGAAAVCDGAVREAPLLCALHPSDAPCEPGRYVSAAGTGARSPTGSCEPGTCGFAFNPHPTTATPKETP